jgi:hypothetical protein
MRCARGFGARRSQRGRPNREHSTDSADEYEFEDCQVADERISALRRQIDIGGRSILRTACMLRRLRATGVRALRALHG